MIPEKQFYGSQTAINMFAEADDWFTNIVKIYDRDINLTDTLKSESRRKGLLVKWGITHYDFPFSFPITDFMSSLAFSLISPS